MRRIFLTFFYSGLSPFAPGTVGSLAAALVGILILQYFSVDTLLLLTVLISIVAIKQINLYEKETGTHDDKSIVIDEVAGLWLAFAFVDASNWFQLALCFVYFRIFDIWKPSIIGRVDREVEGGLGVMGDDIIAGFIAGVCSVATWQVIDMYILQ